MDDEIVQYTQDVGQSQRNKALVSRSGRERKYLTWRKQQDEVFIDVMVDQCKLGRRDANGFTSEGWKAMEMVMKQKFGDDFTKDKLRNRLRTVKVKYKTIKSLLEQSGFSWDGVLKRVVADDNVWNDYVKAHPEVTSYRGKSLLDFEKLAIVYGGTLANGRGILLSNQPPVQSLPCRDHVNLEESQESSSDDNVEEVSKAQRTEKRPSVSTGSGCNKKGRSSSADMLGLMIDSFTKALKKATVKINTKVSQKEVVEAVGALGLEKTHRLLALRLLRDETAASQFLAHESLEERKEWILFELSHKDS